jgi:hypothetical protein
VRAVFKGVRASRVQGSCVRAVFKGVRAVLKGVRAVLKGVRACHGNNTCDSEVSRLTHDGLGKPINEDSILPSIHDVSLSP